MHIISVLLAWDCVVYLLISALVFPWWLGGGGVSRNGCFRLVAGDPSIALHRFVFFIFSSCLSDARCGAGCPLDLPRQVWHGRWLSSRKKQEKSGRMRAVCDGKGVFWQEDIRGVYSVKNNMRWTPGRHKPMMTMITIMSDELSHSIPLSKLAHAPSMLIFSTEATTTTDRFQEAGS